MKKVIVNADIMAMYKTLNSMKSRADLIAGDVDVFWANTINKEGKYPVKIKGYYQKRPKYDSIGICMTKEEWNKLPGSKSFEYRKIKQAIESCFSLVRMNA